MTKEEWLTATDPMSMWEHLRGMRSDRKLRLFACAFFRQLYAPSEALHSIIAVGEKFADGAASNEELRTARRLARRQEPQQTMTIHVVVSDPISVYEVLRRGRPLLHCQRIRDIFGNPFRPVSVDPSWRTSNVLALAQQMYDTRDFSPMPILGDALQDSGCENDDILNHCRSDGPHVRGCWVVDTLLGKE